MADLTIYPEHEDELDIIRKLYLDWKLYGEIHMTNANGLTRLDPRGIKYTPCDYCDAGSVLVDGWHTIPDPEGVEGDQRIPCARQP